MNIKIILIILLLSIFIGGCSFNKEISLVEEGKLALESHDYEHAKELLSQVLEADSTDEQARAMYTQAMKMENVIEYEKYEEYKKAINELEFIEEMKHGSANIKSESSTKKKELVKLNEEKIQVQAQRKENARTVSEKDKYQAEQQAIKLNQQYLAELEAKKEQEEKKQEEEIIGEIKPEGDNNQNVVITPDLTPQITPKPQ